MVRKFSSEKASSVCESYNGMFFSVFVIKLVPADVKSDYEITKVNLSNALHYQLYISGTLSLRYLY